MGTNGLRILLWLPVKSITNQRHSISHYIHHYNTTIAAILIGGKDLSITCQRHEEVGFFDGALILIVPSHLPHYMVKILLWKFTQSISLNSMLLYLYFQPCSRRTLFINGYYLPNAKRFIQKIIKWRYLTHADFYDEIANSFDGH